MFASTLFFDFTVSRSPHPSYVNTPPSRIDFTESSCLIYGTIQHLGNIRVTSASSGSRTEDQLHGSFRFRKWSTRKTWRNFQITEVKEQVSQSMATVPGTHSTWQGNHKNLQEPHGFATQSRPRSSKTLYAMTLTTIYNYLTKGSLLQVRPMLHTTCPMTPTWPVMTFPLFTLPCDTQIWPCYLPMLPCLYAMLFSIFVFIYETDMSAFCSYVAWHCSNVLRYHVFKPMYLCLA